MKRFLVIAEKRDHLDLIVQHLTTMKVIEPNDRIDALITFGLGWWRYRIPKNLTMKDIPFTRVPGRSDLTHQPIVHKNPTILFRLNRSCIRQHGTTEEEIEHQGSPLAYIAGRITEYSKILVSPDADHTGWWAASQMIDMLGEQINALGHDFESLWPSLPTQALILNCGMDYKSISRAYLENTPLDNPHIQNMIAYGQRKRVFDYWWNVGSAVILNATQKLAGHPDPRIISKYELMLLNILERHDDDIKVSDAFRGMEMWQGSGRYNSGNRDRACRNPISSQALSSSLKGDPPRRDQPIFPQGIGTPMSRATIINNLVDNGYLAYRTTSRSDSLSSKQESYLRVTRLGKRLVSILHKRLYDPDLPFRLHAWCQQEDPLPAMAKYIRTVFGSQKRLNGKNQSL